jgi:putative chitinase
LNATAKPPIPFPSEATLKLMLPGASAQVLTELRSAVPLLIETGILAGPAYFAMWLAQAGHESRNFTAHRESLDYSDEALIAKFGRHRITVDEAHTFGRTAAHAANQNALANILYGGLFGREQLGNTQPGDGWKYRGGGGLQVTGRAGYRAVGQVVHMDLENHPELVETVQGSVATAIGVWRWKGLSVFMTKPDPVLVITQSVNGGTNGLSERRANYLRNLDLLNG